MPYFDVKTLALASHSANTYSLYLSLILHALGTYKDIRPIDQIDQVVRLVCSKRVTRPVALPRVKVKSQFYISSLPSLRIYLFSPSTLCSLIIKNVYKQISQISQYLQMKTACNVIITI